MMTPGAQEEKNNVQKVEKKNNILPLSGNERTMNLNPLILTNIQSSHYFKVNLYELKTYHEVIDEIYYKVTHLEPWEKGSRKTAGQTGMCGGVRGVGAGGIVSTAFCLLYKLFTLKLTRKQVNGLITHPDSPYIRALGFMYIRFTQPPADLWDWYDEYLEDPEELDVKAGGGQVMSIGDMLCHFLSKLDWFSTLFPRIPVPIQQGLEKKLSARFPNPIGTSTRPASKPSSQTTVASQNPPSSTPLTSEHHSSSSGRGTKEARHIPDDEVSFGEAERVSSRMRRSTSPTNGSRAVEKKERDRERDRRDERHRSSERHRSVDRHKSSERHRSPDRHRSQERLESRGRDRSRDGERSRDRSREKWRGYERDDRGRGRGDSRDRGTGGGREKGRGHREKESSKHSYSHGRSGKDFSEELMREKERQRKEDKYREREKERSRNSRS